MQESLMREGIDDKWGIVLLQNKILEVMKYVHEFCDFNNISYYLMGGTALGAKRHGGFIPWDDDLDIFMTPDNYEQFRRKFIQSGDKNKFYLQEWNKDQDGRVTIAKLRMNDTTYIESIFSDKDMHQGIYIDIFILHNCPDRIHSRLNQYLWARYIVAKSLSERGYVRRKGLEGMLLRILKLLPSKFLFKFGLKQVYKYRNMNTGYYCNFLGKARYKKGIYKKEWFESGGIVSFERITLVAPRNIEGFLSARFGNYMKIPTNDQIRWEQHAQIWDVYKDFRSYVSNIDHYKDEF